MKETAAAFWIATHDELKYTRLYWDIANHIGIECALLVEIIERWIKDNRKNDRRHYHRAGQWWTSATYEDWAKHYPALGKPRTLQRLLLKLEKGGFVLSEQFLVNEGKQVKFYRTNPEALGEILLLAKQGIVKPPFDFEEGDSVPNVPDPETVTVPDLNTVPVQETVTVPDLNTAPCQNLTVTVPDPNTLLYINRSSDQDLSKQDLPKNAADFFKRQAGVNLPKVEILDQEGSNSLTAQNNSNLSNSLQEKKDPGDDQFSGRRVATKTKEPRTAEDFEVLMNLYNEYKPPVWAKCTLLNDFRIKRFRSLWKMYKDQLAQTWIDALEFAASDPWWKDKPFSIDTILREGKVTELAEKKQGKASKPAAIYDEYDRALSEKGEFF